METTRSKAGIAFGALTVLAAVLFTIAGTQRVAPTHPGQRTYEDACAACHDVGAYGAPRAGNAHDWAPRLARGEQSLYTAALTGRNSAGDRLMPPRGGNPRLTDAEVKAAVDYLITR
jgi:cytochrome c5